MVEIYLKKVPGTNLCTGCYFNGKSVFWCYANKKGYTNKNGKLLHDICKEEDIIFKLIKKEN